MIDAHIHRVIVIDNVNRPIGIVSSTDILGTSRGPTSNCRNGFKTMAQDCPALDIRRGPLFTLLVCRTFGKDLP